MIKAYIDFWKRAFDFRGRSTRPDYWWAYLVNVIIITILTVFCVLIPFFSNVDLSDPALLNNPTELQKIIITYAWPLMIFSLIELIPQLSLQIRRLRCRISSGLGTSKLYRACTNLGYLLIDWKHCPPYHVVSANETST